MKDFKGDTLRICETCGVKEFLSKAQEKWWYSPNCGKSKHGRQGDAWGNPWYCEKHAAEQKKEDSKWP